MSQPRTGTTITTPGRTIGEGDVALFAGLSGDFTPIHVDAQFAATTPHGERIAHGPHVMAVSIGLATQTGMFGERVIGLVNTDWNFIAPVRLGDTIRARVQIEAIRPTSTPGRELASYLFEVFNQHDKIVQQGRIKVIMQATPVPG